MCAKGSSASANRAECFAGLWTRPSSPTHCLVYTEAVDSTWRGGLHAKSLDAFATAGGAVWRTALRSRAGRLLDRLTTSSLTVSLVRSFPPIETPDARVLILGSMPGVASLAAGQYYAHPQNAFWRIVGTLCDFPADAPYAQRVRALQDAGIALWDVLHACERPGSLDASISRRSEVPNDLPGFLRTHPAVRLIAFNGGLAAAAFRRHIAPQLAGMPPDAAPELIRLPSTSPAHASLSFADKLAAWRGALDRR